MRGWLLLTMLSTSMAAHAATIPLQPQPGIELLGVSCGGVHTSTYATGFDKNGNITGKVRAWTRCGASGRGAGYRPRTYSSWHSIVWDQSGTALATRAYDGIVPDQAFTQSDGAGNTVSTRMVKTAYGNEYEAVLQTSRPPALQ